MKWISIFISAVIFTSFGYWLGRRNQASQNPEVLIPSQTDSIKEKFQTLTDQEIKEYYLLKNEQEKYKKADEILGKIVLLLLHDLGVRVSGFTQTAAQEHTKLQNENSIQAPQAKTENLDLPKPLTPEVMTTQSWIQNEKKLSEVNSPTQVAEFLQQVKIDNFEDSLKQTKSFTNSSENLSDFSGRYKGTAQVVNRGKNAVWEIEMNLEANMRGQVLRGLSHIVISENGKTFSNSKDRGEILNLRDFSGGSQATLIRASPSINFQTYYIKSREVMVGNIYQLSKSTIQYEYIGTFELRRE